MSTTNDAIRDAIDGSDLSEIRRLVEQDPSVVCQPIPELEVNGPDDPDFKEKSKERSQILRYRPVTYAAVKAEAEILDFLLSAGGDPSEYSNFPLCRASLYSRCLVTMEMLIQRGADVDRVGNDYGPPLIFAIEGGNIDCMELLLQHGATIAGSGSSLTATVTWDALKHATSFNKGTPGMIDLLLEHGADVQSDIYDPSTDGGSALHGAAEKGDAKGVRSLLRHGADPNAEGSEGKRPVDVTRNANVRKILEKAMS